MPKISVVIPLYNKAAYIRRAIDSVLSQSEQDFEIVVIDDGSTDLSGAIVRSYKDSRVKYYCQHNSGVSVARNAGIEKSESDLLAFLDADDAYNGRFLETVLTLQQKYAAAGMFVTGYSNVEADGSQVRPGCTPSLSSIRDGVTDDYPKSVYQGVIAVCSSAVAIKKKVFREIGCFRSGEPTGEDLDMWFRIGIKYPVAYSSYEGATYYRNTENNSLGMFKCPEHYLATMADAIETRIVSISSVPYVKWMIDRQLISIAVHYMVLGDSNLGRKYLSRVQGPSFRIKKCSWLLASYLPHCVLQVIQRFKVKVINPLCVENIRKLAKL